jgi:hypothetical protein
MKQTCSHGNESTQNNRGTVGNCVFFENKLLRRISGLNRDDIIEGSKKLHNEELHNLHSSSNIIRMIRSRRMRLARHIACMRPKRNEYRVLVGKQERKKPLGTPRHKWENNIKMDLKEIGWGGTDQFNLAQDRDQWQTLVNTVMSLMAS